MLLPGMQFPFKIKIIPVKHNIVSWYRNSRMHNNRSVLFYMNLIGGFYDAGDVVKFDFRGCKDAVELHVHDKRETYSTVDNVYARILEFVIETSSQIVGSVDGDALNETEILVALDTVLPRPGLLHWMKLSEADKVSQLQELKDIIHGIRTFNKYIGKGGSHFVLPIEKCESELVLLWTRVTEELNDAREQSAVYENAIRLHLPKLGMQHVFMQRLRDELTYHLQMATCLEAFQCLLDKTSEVVQNLSFTCSEKLETLQETIGSRKCIPNEIVYPLFQAVGSIQRSISDEYRALQAYSRAAISLLSLSRDPPFQRTPTGISRLSSSYGLAKLRIVINSCEFLPAEVYNTNLSHMERFNCVCLEFGTDIPRQVGCVRWQHSVGHTMTATRIFL